MKLFKNVKNNNKGFSLVELIIVIAIMAVLVGTLAPQYIRYVEKSRMAADATTIDNFVSTLEVLAATSGNGLDSSKTYSIVNTDGKLLPATGDNDGDLANNSVYQQLVDTSKTYELKSSAYKSSVSKITLSYTNNSWKVNLVPVSGQTLPTSAE